MKLQLRTASLSLLFLRVLSPVGPKQQADTHDYSDSAVNRPLDLSRHETAGQHVDALQEPDAPEDHQHNAHDAKRNSQLQFPRDSCSESIPARTSAMTAMEVGTMVRSRRCAPALQPRADPVPQASQPL